MSPDTKSFVMSAAISAACGSRSVPISVLMDAAPKTGYEFVPLHLIQAIARSTTR